MDMYTLIKGLRLKMPMFFLLVNFIRMAYLIICQIGHPIKFDKK